MHFHRTTDRRLAGPAHTPCSVLHSVACADPALLAIFPCLVSTLLPFFPYVFGAVVRYCFEFVLCYLLLGLCKRPKKSPGIIFRNGISIIRNWALRST